MDKSLRIELDCLLYNCARTRKRLWSLQESKEMVKTYSKELNTPRTLKEILDYIDERKTPLKQLGYDADNLCGVNAANLCLAIGSLALHNDELMFNGIWPTISQI